MSNGIATRQNEDNSIAMLAAQRQLYRDAKKYNTVSVALSVWIPFALAVILLFIPENTECRYASYILSIVSMFFSFVIDKYIEEKKQLAAFIQQKFDVYVYEMPWDKRIFGRDKNVDHEIATHSKKILSNLQEKKQLKDWYTPVVDKKNTIDGILACQRENLGWDVGLRKRFKFASIALFIILVAAILAMGLWKNERIIELLWRVVFIAPMLKWLSEWWRFLPSLCCFDGAFCPHFCILTALFAPTLFSALICAGALSAPTLWFWGRFLPPFSCFDGAFCPHTNETALPHP